MPRSYGVVFLVALIVWALLGVLAGQALGNHVQCGDVITQDTTLDSNLIDCPGDGIVIGAEGITLDLNGHTVDGDGGPGDFRNCDSGIVNGRFDSCADSMERGHRGVTVRGGTVSDFAWGVRLTQADDNALLRLRVLDTGNAGVRIVSSTNVLIAGNLIVDHQRSSIAASGILLGAANGNRLEGNTISGSGEHGVELGGHLNRIERNVVFGNGSDGIRMGNARDNLVKRNWVIGNGGDGMEVSDSVFRNRIEGNWVADNGGGIVLGDGAHGHLVEGNSVFRNSLHKTGYDSGGIVLWEGKDNEFTGNRVSGNGGLGGIVLNGECENNIVERNHVAGNISHGIRLGVFVENSGNTLVQGNHATRNGEDGIHVRPNDTDIESTPATSVLLRNIADRNGDDGIDVESPFTTIQANVANRNRDLGVEAVDGVTDAGGNRALRNGNPLQCTNVVCR